MKLKASEEKVIKSLAPTSLLDLVTHYPSNYKFLLDTPIDSWEEGQVIVKMGIVSKDVKTSYSRNQKAISRFSLLIDQQEIECMMFNRSYLRYLGIGAQYYIEAKVNHDLSLIVNKLQKKPLESGIIASYRLKGNVKSKAYQGVLKSIFAQRQFSNFLDDELIERYRLLSKHLALENIHFPRSKQYLFQAQRHLKYEEFFKFQLQLQYQRQLNASNYKTSKAIKLEVFEAWLTNLPFSPSESQRVCFKELISKFNSTSLMPTLIQGDVGSGKTLIGFGSAYSCYLSNYQSVFLAPTQILAKQHYENALKLFKDTNLNVGYLDGSLKKKEREVLLEKISKHEVDLVIGTHALFNDEVSFKNLGLVIIDEQQRFGVRQRQKLRQKGSEVDVILLSATPIPRTLAQGIFNDLDVLSLEPLKRQQKRITKVLEHNSIIPIIDELKLQIAKGNQIYLVSSAIEENDYARAANTLYDNIKQAFQEYQIGLIHGKLKPEEKDQQMQAFLNQETQILVATSVIEVGVDVPNANVIVIYDANRFGLSQLHQLRGRVGRHGGQGYCYLLCNGEDSEALQRLKVLEQTEDGEQIALADLRTRGYGDLLGTSQSGDELFRIANIVEDQHILKVATNDVAEVLKDISKYPIYEAFLAEKANFGND